MEKLLDPLFEMEPLTIYLLLAVFCWAEAAFFLGFLTPGELAVVTGGILASKQIVEFDILLAVVTLATILGNATGFWIGRRYGDTALEWGPIQRFLGVPIEKAQDFMRSKGEWAIVLGRVSTPTRVITPFLAGAAGMAYRRFLVFDIFASLLWAGCFLTLGYVLGESWVLIREISGTAAVLVLGLFLAALLIRWVVVVVIRHQLRLRAVIRLTVRATGTRGLVRALRPGFHWLSRRFNPRIARGLSLSICFLVLTAAVAAVGLVINQTESLWGLARIDFPVLEWMSTTRTEQAVEFSRSALWFFHWPGILTLIVPIALMVAWLAGGSAALRIALGVVGATVGASFLDNVVLEGHVANAEYPSISAAVASVMGIHGVALTMRLRSWASSVACAGVAVFGVLAVALANIVAGWSAPSGIALGIAIGVSWAALLELPWAVQQDESQDREEDSADDEEQATDRNASDLKEQNAGPGPAREVP